MKCPKCQFENPSGIRYCLYCGAQMLPPVPKTSKPQDSVPRSSFLLKPWLVSGILVGLCFFGLLAIVVMALQPAQSSKLAETLFTDTTQATSDSKKVITAYDSRTDYEYVDLTNHTLSIPDSSLKIEFPAYSVCRYDYDAASQQLIFEIETFDGLTITFTSSKLNATPYTKSEAEASLKTGLYHEISGEEDEYYYILPSNGPTATATIVDCTHNRSTNITIYDEHYVFNNEETTTLPQESIELGIIESPAIEEELPEESFMEEDNNQEAVPEESLEIASNSQEKTLDQDQTTKPKTNPSSPQIGSQKAVDALEGLLRSTKLSD